MEGTGIPELLSLSGVMRTEPQLLIDLFDRADKSIRGNEN